MEVVTGTENFHTLHVTFKASLVSSSEFCFDLQVTEILEIAQEAKPEKRSILHKNIASLRKEKDNWKNFMELDERNKETVLEVEAAWRKRYVNYVEFSLDSLSIRFLSIIWFSRQVLFCHQ